MSETASKGNISPSPHTDNHPQTTEIKIETVSSPSKHNELSHAISDSRPNGSYDEHDGGPPSKKRRIAEDFNTQKLFNRSSSPPWKKVTADGPTTFIDNGRRRSGRTNVIPLEQQPQSGKRQTRAAYDKMKGRHGPSPRATSTKSKADVPRDRKALPIDKPLKRGPGRPPKVKLEDSHKPDLPRIDNKILRRTLSRRERAQSPLGKISHEVEVAQDEVLHSPVKLSSPPLILQKVRFRVALPKLSVTTPANIPPSKKYATFTEFLDNDPLEPFLGQETLSLEQVQKEAQVRRRVLQAQESGCLSGTDASENLRERQYEPRKQFAHFDHLLGHVSHFRALLRQEQRDHRRKAEIIAHEAKRYLEEKQKRGRVKTAEELAREHLERMRLQYRSVVKDIERLWLAVEVEVNMSRQKQFEEERQAKIKSHLNRVLERTDEMLTRREESVTTSDVESGTEDPTDGGVDNSDSEDISASSSDSGSDHERNDPDEVLTAEQLRAKYSTLPDVLSEPIMSETDECDEAPGSAIEDSDPDTEMDSEFDSDDGDDDSANSLSEDVDENAEADSDGLLSLFFSKKEVTEMALQSHPHVEASEPNEVEDPVERSGSVFEAPEHFSSSLNGGTGMELDGNGEANQDLARYVEESSGRTTSHSLMDHSFGLESSETLRDETFDVNPGLSTNIEDAVSQDVSVQTSPHTSATKASEPDSISSPEPQMEIAASSTTKQDNPHIKTAIPSLLRGTLRKYQHEGLDWLANLYANGRSGILADEMGLGKTIQSIALLAHLATTYEVWGPHLIVVPTSVMLNWEMEFKKFLPGFKILTYYGSLEERKQKRRGWMADDSFNVCITSYQLVLQDANSFKRRRWHYMILDEAHNIKNFRSERWQTMMTFNTRARLLLTGTPLQNNLTELWSLLFFLHYGQEGDDDDEAFAGLKEWSEWFKRPVESILEHGTQVLDQEDKQQVAKLHKVIRPFLLRRLKADVEKQMPAKYEHVEICRLSKRQRQLYDGFMSRAQTKETLASGNYLSIINALMQLRKVCNHPDLFETRPINTSFAMPKSVAAQFEIQDFLWRRRIFDGNPLDEVDLDFLQLVPISNEKVSLIENLETVKRHAYHPFKALRDSQWSRINRHAVPSGQQRRDILTSLENIGRKHRLQDIDRTMYYEAYRHHQRPIYGRGLLQKLSIGTTNQQLCDQVETTSSTRSWVGRLPSSSLGLVQSVEDRSSQLGPVINHYACLTPAVVATDLSKTLITELNDSTFRKEVASRTDPFHQARMKLSIAFPDKRLLQYDCGKLQRLDKLLRGLQAGGHRALIFTQMTKVLDILEQFLNIHGHRYLRLDGATKIEQRQILTDRFNNDPRILCFILSSRSGGLGINLTGADTVIFYDLDWNPAMDRQCTDRAHRIGQTRDVHIYRFVSEHTIESNILRKANQKQLLDDVVIQEGDFTTDYFNKLNIKDMLDDEAENDVAGAAMDRVLGNDKTAVVAFEHAEDQEDVSAAKVATKEVQHADDGDFEDRIVAAPGTTEPGTPGPFGATHSAIIEAEGEGVHHIDEYLLKIQMYLLKDVPLAPAKDKSKRGRRRGDEHRKRRPR